MSRDKKFARAAFTAVELLVVLAITALFSAFAITYSSIGRNEVSLTVEASKISQFILQAKELAITTYTSSGSLSCGYGVTIDMAATPQTYSIFSYDPQGNDVNGVPITTCQQVAASDIYTRTIPNIDANGNDEEQPYTPGTWKVPISNGVQIVPEPDSLITVLFYPPDPTVLLNKSGDGSNFDPAASTLAVHLRTVDMKNTAEITISPLGQVSIQ